MRRFYSADPRLMLLLGLTVFGAFAWLTRHPDSELARRAEQWPMVGSLASSFRASYSPPPRTAEALGGRDEAGGELGKGPLLVEPVDPDRASARPQVWVEAGERVQISPYPDSEVLATVEALGNYSVVQRRGDWFHIYRYFVDRQALEGWVLLEGYEEPSAERLQRSDPVLPLAAVPPAPQRVRLARSLMVGGGGEARCGPYTLYTDTPSGSMSEPCSQLVDHLEEAYRKRFALVPVGEPAEAIFLFRSRHAYRGFNPDDEPIPADKDGHAAPARGYVALHAEDLPREAVASILVHELTHLINRRALGPALPPWLSEGLADDLAESRIDDSGRLMPGELGGYSLASDGVIQHFGGMVSARKLVEALDSIGLPSLQELVQMGSDEFHEAPTEALLYALSSFWVRYLLSDAVGSEPAGFRAFLEAVSKGESITPDLLALHLSRAWPRLEAGFQIWLRFQTGPLPGAAPVESQGSGGSEPRGSSSRHATSPSAYHSRFQMGTSRLSRSRAVRLAS